MTAAPPEVTLLTCVPHGRLEVGPQSADRRGGVVLHQATPDRLVSGLDGCPLRLFMAVAVRPAADGDALDAVRLTARTGRRGRVAAVCEEREPFASAFTHRYRGYHEPLAIHQFAAELTLGLRYAGLVGIDAEVKLKSRDDFLPAVGRGWCHVTDEGFGDLDPLPAWRYRLTRPFLSATLAAPNRLYRLARRARTLVERLPPGSR